MRETKQIITLTDMVEDKSIPDEYERHAESEKMLGKYFRETESGIIHSLTKWEAIADILDAIIEEAGNTCGLCFEHDFVCALCPLDDTPSEACVVDGSRYDSFMKDIRSARTHVSKLLYDLKRIGKKPTLPDFFVDKEDK